MNTEECRKVLREIEAVLRTRPPAATIRHETPENIEWLGRACAAINDWNPMRSAQFEGYVADLHQTMERATTRGYISAQILLTQARYDLANYLDDSANVLAEKGQHYIYFDEIRKIVELAISEVFFVDPYLDADFVSQYLPFVKDGVRIRLLTKKSLTTLIPAVNAYSKQAKNSLEVRSSNSLHDRFILVDGKSCYQSGASFKDGPKNASTTIVQIHDAFDAIKGTYENLWSDGTKEFA